jgi:transposase
VVTLGELVMILELHRQGLSLAAIARRTGMDRSTVAKYVKRGLEPPCYGPRHPRPTVITPVEAYLRERVAAFPELNGSRLLREIRERGYTGGYTALKDFLRTLRPAAPPPFERRFETPSGQQAQVDFAHFRTTFTDEPGVERIVWLFSLVLGHSRLMWARFVERQDLATVLRCHIGAFEALGGVPAQILYDRMKTAVLGEVDERGIVYNESLFADGACRPVLTGMLL